MVVRCRLSPERRHQTAASAIIAPLSVHSASSGYARARFVCARHSFRRRAGAAFADAAATTRPISPVCFSAAMDLRTSTSTIACWVDGGQVARSCWHTFDAGAARASSAVLSPANEKSRSPLCSRGRGSRTAASPNSASRASAGPAGIQAHHLGRLVEGLAGRRHRWSRRAVRTTPRRRRASAACGRQRRAAPRTETAADRPDRKGDSRCPPGGARPAPVCPAPGRPGRRPRRSHQQRPAARPPLVNATTSMSASVRPGRVHHLAHQRHTRRM